MKLSNSGKIIHFHFASGGIFLKTIGIVGALLIVSLTLALNMPEFAIYQPGFQMSSNPLLATVQAVNGIVLLGSMAVGAVLGVLALFWFPPEIICEKALKKRTLKIIQDRGRISLSDLAEEIGVDENDVVTLLNNWVSAWNKDLIDPTTGIVSGNHMNLDLVNKEISWR